MFITVEGKTMSVTQWAKQTGASRRTIYWRLQNGKPESESIIPAKDVYALQSGEAYTVNELYEIWSRFANEPEALQKLADFAGTTTEEAEELLKYFKKRRAGQ